ncbi:MAG: diguanylate cyclase [Oscillospiraceae bacterium]|nr:diguanylate cyclase [Oscillospiraceae bacterium]
MHSIRTKISAATIGAIIITMIIATVLGVVAIRDIGTSSSEQMLMLLCEAGQKNLDDYLEDLEQDVGVISAYVEADLDGLSDEALQAHLDRVSDFFKKIMLKTKGVKTYYYRIDPTVSSTVKGFWYVDLDGEGFREHEVTDITLYDTADTSALVWFTVPKYEGKAVWLPPYITDNLDVRVISYNIPVYFKGQFIGVLGIELDYTAMAEQVNNITLYENGYAFVNDPEGTIIYHPRMDVTSMETAPKAPEGLLVSDSVVHYNYEGTEKLAVWLPLINGDHLNVTVPMSEINAGWQHWVLVLVITFTALLIVFILFILKYTGKIIKPLQQLTEVAEQIDKGNYDCTLDYKGDDEIGVLTHTFSRVTANLKKTITDLNDLAYADALTSLHNKGAFDICVRDIQTQIDAPDGGPAFAVCIFDCNDLKKVNDQNGHDKGDIYLKETAEIICEVYEHSPVFRIGGDEFAALLMDRDYQNRDELLRQFDERCLEKRRQNSAAWEQVNVARGMAVYDPDEDESVSDVVRRADKIMYENKFMSKRQANKTE